MNVQIYLYWLTSDVKKVRGGRSIKFFACIVYSVNYL
jgi:hypothetical protein